MKRHPKPFPKNERQLDLFSDASAASVPAEREEPGAAQPVLPQPPAPSAPIALRPPSSLPGLRRIVLEGHAVDYSLRRSKRRSIGFMISDEGLRISAPRWVTLGGIEEAIRNKTRWILSKLAERRDHAVRQQHAPSIWTDGGQLPFFGGTVTLRTGDPERGPVFDAVAGELCLGLAMDAGESEFKLRVQQWLAAQAQALFAERLLLWAGKLGVSYRSFALSSAATQWGSCTSAGRIRLNWRLMHFALPLIDYVIIHELSHLREMNHSPRFWATVASVCPDYEASRQALQKRSREIMHLFA